MNGLSYWDRDYAFGQAMLTWRTRIGMTQAELAAYLGISRRAVGSWEAGSNYPNFEHLKQFVALAVERQFVPEENQAEEVRFLWGAAHQKVMLDESWLGTLLYRTQNSQSSQVTVEFSGVSGTRTSPARLPRLHWDEALSVPIFYGREWETNLLYGWLVDERNRVVSVSGLGGIGKSALAVSLMHLVAEHFEVVIWRSLHDLPSGDSLLDDLLQVLAARAPGGMPDSLEQCLKVLLEQLAGEGSPRKIPLKASLS